MEIAKLRISSWKRLGVQLVILSFCLGTVSTQDSPKAPILEWDMQSVDLFLTESPWSTQIMLKGLNTAASGDPVTHSYTLRLFSALPVREAYVRMFQLLNDYDEQSREAQTALEKRFSSALRKMTDEIVINFDFDSTDPQTRITVRQWLSNLDTAQVKNSVFLMSSRVGRVGLAEFLRPAPDGTGAKFVFPKKVNGSPVAMGVEDTLKIELMVPSTGQRVTHSWRLRDLYVDGKPEF